MIQRAGQVLIRMLENVKQVTIGPLIQETITEGSVVYTDEYDIYARLPEWGYDHRTVCHAKGEYARVYVFHNRPQAGALYEPVSQRLLPLDAQWQQGVAQVRWPAGNRPEVMGGGTTALRALLREYLFISLFRACAESLASENASRLAAMQRAEKNIDNSLEDLNRIFHRLRQSGIDEELFDVVAGFEALSGKER